MLPADIVKENTAQFEEVYIPPTHIKPPRETDNFIKISDLDEVNILVELSTLYIYVDLYIAMFDF